MDKQHRPGFVAAIGRNYRSTNHTRLGLCRACGICVVFEATIRPKPFTTATANGRQWHAVDCPKCHGPLYQTTHLTKKPKHRLDGSPIGKFGYHVPESSPLPTASALEILRDRQESLNQFDDRFAIQKLQNVIHYLTAPAEYAGCHALYGSLEQEGGAQ
jgi:hypothetical protein